MSEGKLIVSVVVCVYNGADTISYALAVEELSAACGSTGLSYAAHTSLSCMPLLWFGNEAQKRKYLPKLQEE